MRSALSSTPRVPTWLRRVDHALIGFVRRYGLTALRMALGIVFVWFGALKLYGLSPVAGLIAGMLAFLPPEAAVTAVGISEVLIGVGLITGWAIRLTLLVFFVEIVGTFLVFLLFPNQVFLNGNPLLLTSTGEFIVKNLVLLTAGLTVGSTVPRARRDEPLARMLVERAGPTRSVYGSSHPAARSNARRHPR